jgi:hypothetical protein
MTMTDFPSVFLFFVALLLFTTHNTTTEIRVSVGVASGIVVFLIICCVVNSWDSGIDDSERDELKDILHQDEAA